MQDFYQLKSRFDIERDVKVVQFKNPEKENQKFGNEGRRSSETKASSS